MGGADLSSGIGSDVFNSLTIVDLSSVTGAAERNSFVSEVTGGTDFSSYISDLVWAVLYCLICAGSFFQLEDPPGADFIIAG